MRIEQKTGTERTHGHLITKVNKHTCNLRIQDGYCCCLPAAACFHNVGNISDIHIADISSYCFV